MNEILTSILKVDLSQVSADVLEGLQTGKMILSSSNGNVYWAADSGGKGIVAHLPLIPVSPQELASAQHLLEVGQAVSGAKVAALTATAAGTAVVVIAVVLATKYIAGKIDRVHELVNDVQLTVEKQDQREYLAHTSEYTGAIKAAHELLNSGAPHSEISSQAELQLAKLASSRQKMLLFVKGLRPLISSRKNTKEAQYKQVLSFTTDMLDLVPSALAIERELCFATNKPVLAKNLRDQSAQQFRQELSEFKEWCQQQYQQLALGNGGFADVLHTHRKSLNNLFNSPVHDLLLDGLQAGNIKKPVRDSIEPRVAESGTPTAKTKFHG